MTTTSAVPTAAPAATPPTDAATDPPDDPLNDTFARPLRVPAQAPPESSAEPVSEAPVESLPESVSESPSESLPETPSETPADAPDPAPARRPKGAGAHAGAHAGAAPSRLASHGLIGLTRIMLGFVFLWTFLDKMYGLGYDTPRDQAWQEGGSPTTDFLSSREGTFGELSRSLAGEIWVDRVYLLGMGLVGVALVLGIAMRLAALGAVALMGAIYLASLPLAGNPVVDQHLVYAGTAVTLTLIGAGRYLGLGRWWGALPGMTSLRWLT